MLLQGQQTDFQIIQLLLRYRRSAFHNHDFSLNKIFILLPSPGTGEYTIFCHDKKAIIAHISFLSPDSCHLSPAFTMNLRTKPEG